MSLLILDIESSLSLQTEEKLNVQDGFQGLVIRRDRLSDVKF